MQSEIGPALPPLCRLIWSVVFHLPQYVTPFPALRLILLLLLTLQVWLYSMLSNNHAISNNGEFQKDTSQYMPSFPGAPSLLVLSDSGHGGAAGEG